jgi:hypothetical protein
MISNHEIKTSPNIYQSIQSKPPHAVTCIKRSPFSCPIIENFIWIESLLRGHLSYKAIFLCPKGDLLMYNRVPWDKKTERVYDTLIFFLFLFILLSFFLMLKKHCSYIYTCIIVSNDNNQCMQFVCPYCGPIDWNNKYSYSYFYRFDCTMYMYT